METETSVQPTPSEVAAKPARPRAALVLGAGGARGLSHIGVIEALEEAGFELAAIVGSSMGALVGGIHAAGRLAEYRRWVGALERGDVLRLLDFAFGHPGLIKGDKIIGALRELVGEHLIEDLPIPFVAVATDLQKQREHWLTKGRLFSAIRASMAIPMVFTPHRVNGHDLVDGGLLAPIPIAATRLFSADLVIAVDANSQQAMRRANGERVRRQQSSAASDPGSSAESNGLRAKIGEFVERLLGRQESEPAQAGLMELMSLSLDTVQARISQMQLALDPPDLLIQIPHDACYFYEFWRAREMIELGRKLTGEVLERRQA
jgi:NTE family protein